MREVLNMELKYTAVKQLLTTALAISIGGILLKYLPLGFNDLMEGYFRTLCVGYGIYAIANTMLLLFSLNNRPHKVIKQATVHILPI